MPFNGLNTLSDFFSLASINPQNCNFDPVKLEEKVEKS
jgi:hypothetical protein